MRCVLSGNRYRKTLFLERPCCITIGQFIAWRRSACSAALLLFESDYLLDDLTLLLCYQIGAIARFLSLGIHRLIPLFLRSL